MSTAFLCGNISEDAKKMLKPDNIPWVFGQIVEKYDIDKVFITQRTDFEYNFYFSLLNIGCVGKIDVIRIADTNKKDPDYQDNLRKSLHFETVCPFNEEVENKYLYRKMYDYAIENSEYMITFFDYDDDISAFIAEKAKEKNIKVINVRDYFNKGLFGFTLKEEIESINATYN